MNRGKFSLKHSPPDAVRVPVPAIAAELEFALDSRLEPGAYDAANRGFHREIGGIGYVDPNARESARRELMEAISEELGRSHKHSL